jgi:hypothetical protein
MLYAFPLEGHQVVDLSYLGVNEAVRLMNNSGKWQITVDPASPVVDDVTEDLGDGPEPCYCATVYAVNKLTGYGQFGTYTQAKRLKLTDANKIARRRSSAPDSIDEHDRIADKFSRQKAVNKAQRNSLRIHIPEELRQQIIAQYRGQPDAVERIQIGAGVQGLADLPAPLTDDRAIAQRETARALYDEIRKVDPAAVLPGQYHTYLSRAEHDHERLDDFVAYLNGKLEELKAAKDA